MAYVESYPGSLTACCCKVKGLTPSFDISLANLSSIIEQCLHNRNVAIYACVYGNHVNAYVNLAYATSQI